MPRRPITDTRKPDLPRAFRTVRVAKGVAQEEFDVVSSRTYVSLVERGVNSPTLAKIDALVSVLGLHPLTVLALSYADSPTLDGVSIVLERVQREVQSLGLKDFSGANLAPGIKADRAGRRR